MPATRYGRDSSLPVRSSRIQCSRSSWVKVVVGAGERCAIATDRLMRVVFAPDEERSDQLPGGGSGGNPFVDVELAACRVGAAVGVVEPGQELDGFGDVLFRGVDRSAGGFACGRDCADSFEMVPGRELFSVAPNRAVIDGGHLCSDPALEEGEVAVTRRNQLVMFDNAPQVHRASIVADAVEALVGHRNAAGCQLAQQLMQLDGSFPDLDAFGRSTAQKQCRRSRHRQLSLRLVRGACARIHMLRSIRRCSRQRGSTFRRSCRRASARAVCWPHAAAIAGESATGSRSPPNCVAGSDLNGHRGSLVRVAVGLSC